MSVLTASRSAKEHQRTQRKYTATRLSSILGCNHWKSDFGVWCEIMRVAEVPFEDNQYTIAGKVIEPKQVAFAAEYISPFIDSPSKHYGKPDDKLGWDFFPNDDPFGGKWDALVKNRKGDILGVYEAKTTSRPQDWENGVPDNYAAQALMYGFLLGVDDVWVGVSFLKPEDYDNPEAFECNEENTRFYPIKVSDGLGGVEFNQLMDNAKRWWDTYVMGNMSPIFDKKKDKEYLDIMKASVVELPSDVSALSVSVANLEDKLTALKKSSGVDALEKELKTAKDKQLKVLLESLVEPGRGSVETNEWLYKQDAPSLKIDTKKMEEDGILEQYQTTKEGSWRLTRKKEK